jgi:Acyclic terpene utilisation family protein AtuA
MSAQVEVKDAAAPGGGAAGPRRPVRIANCSGFYGDRAAAAREMVDGGPIDVLTGDYLAELTMLILWKARQKDPGGGYARTFLGQFEQVIGSCLDRGITIVVNAGGLNPAGLADRLREIAARLGLAPKIAHVEGDDLLGRLGELTGAGHELANTDTGEPLAKAGVTPVTANAYLGGWGIAVALRAGADVVVCPRVTDAALVVGPAAAWHGWGPEDLDALAGAVAAGHVIECGPQATGGNYPFLDELPDLRYPGFPIAEVAADGSSVITKHPGTGGLVSVGTVTAQLLYEIAGPAYANPDVVARFDTIRLDIDGPDRVRISGTRGSPPPTDLKVALNYLGGYRNTMTMVLTGLDIEQKAARAEAMLFELLGGKQRFGEVDVRLIRSDRPDAPTNEQATAQLRITVADQDPARVGRSFSGAAIELALASYAGFHTTTPPTPETAYGVYWPTFVPATVVEHVVVLPDGSRLTIPPPTADTDAPDRVRAAPDRESAASADEPAPDRGPAGPHGSDIPTRWAPLGLVCGARSGDKGGNANVGLWTKSPEAYGWLREYLDVARLRELLPEADGLEVRRYELPNLQALNFVVVGLLGLGVAASARPDPQAKGLGEFLRSRYAEIPTRLLPPT